MEEIACLRKTVLMKIIKELIDNSEIIYCEDHLLEKGINIEKMMFSDRKKYMKSFNKIT